MDIELLVKLQKEKAYRFLQEADDMVEQGRWNLASNRYYYACYHIIQAAFIKNGVSAKSHDGTLTELGRHFILRGLIDKKYGRFFARIIQLRLKADYNSIAEVSESEVLEMSPLSHDFVKCIAAMQ
ncbi:MAG: HEPN domain-containing protein [Bacteroidaceae bacterium]|nr:HEPN domain-containing protein [Bacteroidaceae bacterium]